MTTNFFVSEVGAAEFSVVDITSVLAKEGILKPYNDCYFSSYKEAEEKARILSIKMDSVKEVLWECLDKAEYFMGGEQAFPYVIMAKELLSISQPSVQRAYIEESFSHIRTTGEVLSYSNWTEDPSLEEGIRQRWEEDAEGLLSELDSKVW